MAERLQKIISQAGIASRRGAEKLIVSGRVKVNGQIITELGAKVEEGDKVEVDNREIFAEKHIYIIMYKPAGVVTTVNDPWGRKTVIDLLHGVTERVYPVGRLDYNTEGLLLLTNDGVLTHALIHPSKKIPKTYLATVYGVPKRNDIELLRRGIMLDDGLTAPAEVDVLGIDRNSNTTKLQIVIHEGKNRQVRRMCDAIGHKVLYLKRIRFACLSLQGLKKGQYRYLSSDEVEKLRQMVNM